jgi:hypothetical protein
MAQRSFHEHRNLCGISANLNGVESSQLQSISRRSLQSRRQSVEMADAVMRRLLLHFRCSRHLRVLVARLVEFRVLLGPGFASTSTSDSVSDDL